MSATTPSWRHIWSSTHTKRPSLDHTRNCQPSPNQLSNFNFLRGHRLPPNRCHRFRHPRAQTTPHHSIIHTPKIPVHHPALVKFQFSKGSPPPTQSLPQIPSSTRTNDPHHSIIHAPKMIVYLAPNIFQFSRGSPAPTLHSSQIRSSTRTKDSAQLDHPPTANTSPPSSTRQISIF